MKNEAEKPIKLGDDPLVSSKEQHEKTVAERSVVKIIQRQLPKARKPQSLLIHDS